MRRLRLRTQLVEPGSFPDRPRTGMLRDEPVSEPPAYPAAAPSVRLEDRPGKVTDEMNITRATQLHWPTIHPALQEERPDSRSNEPDGGESSPPERD